MDPETLAMCMLDRLICTPEDRRGELRYRDGFINHHVTHAFQEQARELAMDGVVVTHSVDARAALPEFADALLEAWAHLEPRASSVERALSSRRTPGAVRVHRETAPRGGAAQRTRAMARQRAASRRDRLADERRYRCWNERQS